MKNYVLDNGVEVYTINAGAEEVIQLEWVFRAGNWFEKKNLIAASTNFLLKNGTNTKNAFQINEHFEYYGSYLNRNCYNETATVTLHALSKHLEHLLPVVKELLTDSIFPGRRTGHLQAKHETAPAGKLKERRFRGQPVD